MSNEPELLGIQELADKLGTTTRTLRFYEDRGLLEPQRVGNVRVYTRREVARIKLILRGKRLGFSLKDIKAFLDLYDADPEHLEQMRVLAVRCQERIDELRHQRAAIELTISELGEMHNHALSQVEALSRTSRAVVTDSLASGDPATAV